MAHTYKVNIMTIKSVIKSALMLASALALFVLLVFTTGCFSSESKTPDPQNTQAESVATARTQTRLVPALYAVFDDKTGSTASARITPIQEHDLLVLVDNLRLTGGELAYGLIGESTDRPLLRLRVGVPPARPIMQEVQNAFERAEQEARFQEELEKYESDLKQWKKDVDRSVSSFLEAVRPRLLEKATAKRSPINSALTRSELFLNEPTDSWPVTPHRYIILNSDAIDTTKSARVTIKSGATLILINGSGSLGVIESLNPLRFESVQAALDHITATEIGRKK